MLFFYIRHGDPVYNPDSLTPLGSRQAEAVAKRLALYGVDKVYASTSNRAYLTSKPTCELLKLEPEQVDFANEGHVWKDLTIEKEDGSGITWLFQHPGVRKLFHTPELRQLGEEWYTHPAFGKYDYQKGIQKVRDASDAFFAELGFEHIRHTGQYRITEPKYQRVAMFAHQGFGLTFLSCLLDIPFPMFSTHFDICHSGMTVVEFPEDEEYSIPRILTFSSDSHIYREGLPTNYNNILRF